MVQIRVTPKARNPFTIKALSISGVTWNWHVLNHADPSERWHILDYDSAVAMRYHGRRKSFFDLLTRLDPALTVIFGGAAFATIISGYTAIGAAIALLAAVVSALNLAFGLGDRARLHESLFRQWGMLRAELAVLPDGDEAALRRLEAKRAQIDAASPWQLLALSVLCENEEKRVRRAGILYRVGWLQRFLINSLTLPGWRPIQDADASGQQTPVQAVCARCQYPAQLSRLIGRASAKILKHEGGQDQSTRLAPPFSTHLPPSPPRSMVSVAPAAISAGSKFWKLVRSGIGQFQGFAEVGTALAKAP